MSTLVMLLLFGSVILCNVNPSFEDLEKILMDLKWPHNIEESLKMEKQKPSYDSLFESSSASGCENRPQEDLRYLHLPIAEANVETFSNSEYFQELPQAVQNVLSDYFSSQTADGLMHSHSDVFGRIALDPNTSREKLEVGNLAIKAFKHNKQWNILILYVALVQENEEGCLFTKKFRDRFVETRQDMQQYLATKAVMEKSFRDIIVDFEHRPAVSAEDLVKKFGYTAVKVGDETFIHKTSDFGPTTDFKPQEFKFDFDGAFPNIKSQDKTTDFKPQDFKFDFEKGFPNLFSEKGFRNNKPQVKTGDFDEEIVEI